MKRPTLRRGRQLEIVTSLCVVMLAGLAIVAVVVGSLAARSVEESALARMRMSARVVERILGSTAQPLADVAPVARARWPRIPGATLRILDDRGTEVGLGPPRPEVDPEMTELLDQARGHGEVVARGGLPLGDLVLVQRVARPSGEGAFLVVRLADGELAEQMLPLLRAGAWVLLTAAAVFVAFGAYLLRRRIVLPLRQLSDATRRITGGDLEVRTEVGGANELGDLAESFNRMAASLAREHAALVRAHESLSRSRSLATVGQLAAGIAYEVGNPVAAILGYSEVMLRDDGLSVRSREMAERARNEALRIRALVRELLDLSRPESVDPALCIPDELIGAAADRLRSQPILSGIALEVVRAPDVAAVETDARRVEQVLVNLVENAAHALRGMAGARIELSAEPDWSGSAPGRRSDDSCDTSFVTTRAPDAVAICVIDNGPGIDPDVLPCVFDPFFTTKDPGEGTGLGLSNAHRIAELLDGQLEAASEPGRTCFRLVLPVADTKPTHGAPPHPDHR